MSGHHDEHRSCEALASSSKVPGQIAGQSRLQEPVPGESSGSHVLSDTDSGVADTDETGRRLSAGSSGRLSASSSRISVGSSTGGRTSSYRHGARPRASAAASTSSSVDLHTLRDPSHYEELSVIGNGKSNFNCINLEI